MSLLKHKLDLPAYYREAGRQVGKERAAIDRDYRMVRDPETLWIPEGAHPAWVEGLKEGYLANLTTADPLTGALSEHV